MIGSQQFRHDLDSLPHTISIGSRRVHREYFHSLLHWMLAGGEQLSLGGAAAALLPINLHHAKPADRDRTHVRLVAQNRNWNFRFVSELFYVKLPCCIKDRCITRCSTPFPINHDVSIGVRQWLS